MPTLIRTLLSALVVPLVVLLSSGLATAADNAAAQAPAAPELNIGPDDTVEHEDWLNGYLNEQPMANMHMVTVRHADGTRTTLSNTAIVFKRQLVGFESLFTINDNSLYREHADGRLESVEIHNNENGKRTIAVASIGPEQVDVVVHSPTGTHSHTIDLPDGVQLIGMEASQRAMAEADLKPGQSEQHYGLALMGGEMRLMSMTITLDRHLSDTVGRYHMVIDSMPNLPMSVDVQNDGSIVGMTMAFGPMAFDFRGGDGPIGLDGAELSMNNLVTHRGPAPAAAAINRYRLPQKSRHLFPQDAFQSFDESGALRVFAVTGPSELADPAPYLQSEAQIETDAEEIQEWVDQQLTNAPEPVADRARLLTQAVSQYLTGDLGRGEASALEAFRSRKGDCSEHSNLLVTALRIAGIPSRVEVGFVYAGALGGWGGHAWVAAYDTEEGRWIHLDAAYPGIPRSCYIRTGSSTGQKRGTNAMLDYGMSLVLGETIEFIPQ